MYPTVPPKYTSTYHANRYIVLFIPLLYFYHLLNKISRNLLQLNNLQKINPLKKKPPELYLEKSIPVGISFYFTGFCNSFVINLCV